MVAVVTGELSPMVTGIIYCSVIEGCREAFELERAAEWTQALTDWCKDQPDLVAFGGECLMYRADIMRLNDFSPSMIELLRARASAAGLANISAAVMDGNSLEFEDDTFEASGSQFGVMLFPDIGRGLTELVRVTKPGGHVVVITMGPPSEVEFLTYFVSAVKTAVPGFAGLPTDPPPLPLRLAAPSRLHAALTEAGLSAIDVKRASYSVEHPSADHLWKWVVSSNPIGAMIVANFTAAQKAVALEALSSALHARSRSDGPAVLHNGVNIGVGRVQ